MNLATVRLLQLTSQALPIGGYSYSSGLESAIEHAVVADAASLYGWIEGVLRHSLFSYEIPLLVQMQRAWRATDHATLAACNEEYLATRESAQLRAATLQMGSSLHALLTRIIRLDDAVVSVMAAFEEVSLPLMWSAAAAAWDLALEDSAAGYLWSWAENQVLVAVKTIPLGQTSGQETLSRIGELIAGYRLPVNAEAAGSNFSPGLAILCARHETQYSRLFRS